MWAALALGTRGRRAAVRSIVGARQLSSARGRKSVFKVSYEQAVVPKFHDSALMKTSRRRFCSGSPKYRTAKPNALDSSNTNVAIYLTSLVVFGVGVSYAAVPLYKMFCQVTGYGGTTQAASVEQAKNMVPVPGAAPVRVQFVCNTSSGLPWKFRPQQKEVTVVPGETALAFYTASNTSDEPIVGISTYNITPQKAGIYFHKIQCFCFDQQRLRPKEEVDMPVFFYIDPTFCDDPRMNGVTDIVLSYTFYKAKN